MNAHFLQAPIEYLKGVGPNRADLLKKELGIHTFQDLMHYFQIGTSTAPNTTE